MSNRETGEISVCFVSPKIYYYLPSCSQEGAGGAEHQQYLLSQRLIEEGFKVSFVTKEYDDSVNHTQEDGISIYRSIPDITGIHKSPVKIARILYGLYQTDADIFYVRSGTLFTVLTSLYCNIFKKDLIYAAATDKDVSPRRKNSNPILRGLSTLAIQAADKVVVQTNHQRKLFKQNFDEEALVIPNGQSIPPESELINHEEREFVLWVGRIDAEQKHPERYLEVAKELSKIEFCMIGVPMDSDEGYFDEIRQRAGKIPNLDFIGYVPPENIAQYYQSALILVNTSDYEGFPNVFLEAWKYETPVISLYFSLDDEIRINDIGRVSGNQAALISDIEEFSQDTELRSFFGKKGREHMKSNYSFEKTADKYISLFDTYRSEIK